MWESGPWNVDDNYWSTSRDPQPRRMFADLPAGMPEAQAAFFDGYNGGVDQYGRTVTAPFGIDLGRQVSIDIGLQPGNNDWINITFAWTEGWDKAKKPEQGSSGQGDRGYSPPRQYLRWSPPPRTRTAPWCMKSSRGRHCGASPSLTASPCRIFTASTA